MAAATVAAEPAKLGKTATAHGTETAGPSLALIFIAPYHPDAGCLLVRYRPPRSKYESVAVYLKLVGTRLASEGGQEARRASKGDQGHFSCDDARHKPIFRGTSYLHRRRPPPTKSPSRIG